jgi:hypothetical protein
MSIVHLVCEVIEVSIKVIIGLGWEQTISGGAFDGVGKRRRGIQVEVLERVEVKDTRDNRQNVLSKSLVERKWP